MAAERLSMRKIREVLRLHAAGQSQRAIAESVLVARSTGREYVQRAGAQGLRAALPARSRSGSGQLFPPPRPSTVRRPLPDWAAIYEE